METTIRKLIAAAALSVAATVACAAPVKIGFLGEFSGPQMAYGRDMYDGFMLAVEQGGGKLGGVDVQILKEDTQLKPDLATQVAQRLIEKEGVPIIAGVSFSNIMMAIHRQVTEKEVFLVGTNAGPSPLAGEQCSPYQFFASRQGDQQSEAVGRYAMEKGYKNVIAMAPNYQGGKDVIAGFKRTFTQGVIDEIYTPLNQLDFSVELTQLAARQPDAIFVFYPSNLGISFVRQFHAAGLIDQIDLLSMGTVDALTLPSIGEAATGVISGTYWAPDSENPASVKFAEAFEEKTGRIPSEVAAASYDGALLIGSALAKVGGDMSKKEEFMAAMKAADFESVRGKFRFNNNHYPVQDFYVVKAAKDSKGRMNLETLQVYPDMADAYASQCAMK